MDTILVDEPIAESRAERRRRRNKQALIEAAYAVISSKGIDAATIQEIAGEADVGLGTIYNYFDSKDELVVAMMNQVMDHMAQRIQMVTDTFDDPARVFAYGVRTVMDAATTDPRWRWLIMRPEVMAVAMFRCFAPYAVRDIEIAVKAGRYHVEDAELTWQQAAWAIVGVSIAVREERLSSDKLTNAVVNLLRMVGVDPEEALKIAQAENPPLPKESLFRSS